MCEQNRIIVQTPLYLFRGYYFGCSRSSLFTENIVMVGLRFVVGKSGSYSNPRRGKYDKCHHNLFPVRLKVGRRLIKGNAVP